MSGDDWVDDVADALKGLDIFDEKTRQALAEGVRDALSSAQGSDAGRPATPTGKPSLRVVEPDEGGEPEEPSVRVHVLPKVTTSRVSTHASAPQHRSLDVGRVQVGDADWQTVRTGIAASVYRLHCDAGEIHVALDGELAVQIKPGQTVDVEAKSIRVRAADGVATGRFVGPL